MSFSGPQSLAKNLNESRAYWTGLRMTGILQGWNVILQVFHGNKYRSQALRDWKKSRRISAGEERSYVA